MARPTFFGGHLTKKQQFFRYLGAGLSADEAAHKARIRNRHVKYQYQQEYQEAARRCPTPPTPEELAQATEQDRHYREWHAGMKERVQGWIAAGNPFWADPANNEV